MAKLVLDTNVYIHAMRNADARSELADWQRCMAPHIHQHAVVVTEVLAGARTIAIRRRWHERWIAPAERVGRVIVPDYRSWLTASAILTKLFETGVLTPGGIARGFFNDCLLAASCSISGHTIVTYNLTDFARIARVQPGVRFVAPLP